MFLLYLYNNTLLRRLTYIEGKIKWYVLELILVAENIIVTFHIAI